MRYLLAALAVALLLGSAGCAGTAPDGVGDEFDQVGGVSDWDSEPDGSDSSTGEEDGTTVRGELELHHIDVGQGDATLLLTPRNETVLVDTGDWRQDGDAVIDYLESLGIERIDHLVATHGHADHIGGHTAVIEHFETDGEGVGTAYDAGVVHDSATFERYLDAIDEHGVELLLVEEGDVLPLDDESVRATVLNPPAENGEDGLHENSVALAVRFGEFGYLTTGDAEADVEQRLVEKLGDELDVDVYQAGHHGSSTSSSAAFLDAVSPDVVVISSAYDSQYGHPHDEVLGRLAEREVETYWTGVHGDVVVTTNGTAIEVETSGAFPTDPEGIEDTKPDDEGEESLPPPRTDTRRAPIQA